MREGLGFLNYLTVSAVGHAVALVGLGYGGYGASFHPATLNAASEVFSVEIVDSVGEGAQPASSPLEQQLESPAQALLPVAIVKEAKPEKPVRQIVKRVELQAQAVRASYNPKSAAIKSVLAESQSSEGQSFSGNSHAGGGAVGGVSAVFAPKPPYPWAARVAGFEGRVVLELAISELGRVQEAKIIETSGREDCDLSALKTVKEKWSFEPARINGAPVNCTERVSVRYVLR